MLIQMLRGVMLRPAYAPDAGTGGDPPTDPPGDSAVTIDPPADPPSDAEIRAELERTRAALKAANKEAADRRKRLEALEAADQERQQAEMTELDKTKAALEKLKKEHEGTAARLRRAALKDAAREAAQKAGLAFAVGALADAVDLGAFDDLEVGGDGAVAGMSDAIKVLQKKRPYLFAPSPGAPDINAGARGNGTTSQDVLTANRERLLHRRY